MSKAGSESNTSKAAAAIDIGKFKDQIVPVEVDDVYVKDGKKITSLARPQSAVFGSLANPVIQATQAAQATQTGLFRYT